MHTRSSSRKGTRLRLGGLALTSLALTALVPIAAQAQSYTLTILGGDNSDGYGVNNSGQVIGNGTSGAFLSGPNGGSLKFLGTLPGGTASSGSAVNAGGQVTGAASTASGDTHAFVSDANGGPLKDLGTVGTSSIGNGVNDSGQVTGSFGDFTHAHAFISGANSGPLKDLGTLPGGTTSSGSAVNAGGQVTGYSDTTISQQGLILHVTHAFLSSPNGGALQDLGVLPGESQSYGTGLNSSGQVVGYSETLNDRGISFRPNAFLFSNSVMTNLGTLPGDTDSKAFGINAAGQIVGYSDRGGAQFGPMSAFLYSNGVMTDLNTLIAPGSGFTLTQANGISDTGFITGFAINSNNQTEAFLLTPTAPVVPEASSTVSLGLLLALGLGGVTVAARKRRGGQA